MELRHLRYFCAVAEAGGFSPAARRLHVAQSAVSEQIRDLEQEIGVPLLHRDKRQLRLTPHGEIFLAEVREVLAQADRAVDMAQRSLRGEVGRLSIGFMIAATSPFFSQVIREYRVRYPGVRLALHEMSPARQMDALVAGEIDIGFTRSLGAQMPPSLAYECLHKDAVVVVLPLSHPLAATPGPVPVTALARERFVLYDRDAWPNFHDTVVGICTRAGFSPRVTHSALMQTVLTLVGAEEGIAIVPESVRHYRPKGLVFRRLEGDDERVSLLMVWRSDSHATAQEAFLEQVRAAKPEIHRLMRGSFGDDEPAPAAGTDEKKAGE